MKSHKNQDFSDNSYFYFTTVTIDHISQKIISGNQTKQPTPPPTVCDGFPSCKRRGRVLTDAIADAVATVNSISAFSTIL